MDNKSIEVKNYLDKVRSKLLDLSLKNRSLNFKATKNKSLALTTAQLNDIYKKLSSHCIVTFQSLQSPTKSEIVEYSLLPAELLEKIDDLELKDYKAEINKTKWANEKFALNTSLDIPTSMESTLSDSKDWKTTLFSDEYDTYFNKLFLTKENIVQEIGCNALYLVLGFLEWQDDASKLNQKILSPLLLAPVQLNRTNNNRGTRYLFSLSAEDDFTLNKTLQKKMERDFNIVLPDFEGFSNVDDYLFAIQEVISKTGKYWHIKRRVYLAVLDFTKLAMYEDLEAEKWPKDWWVENENIQTLLFGSNREQSTLAVINPDLIQNFDRDVPLVLDADSSQSAAINEVLAGRNLVIEGPPGTGKSQTITNLIAALISEGKTVLFASEKLAAMKVVKNKLDALGLGDFCLELHSDQTDKYQLRVNLKKRLELKKTRISAKEINDELEKYSSLKSRLNQYIDTVNSNLEGTDINIGPILQSASRYRRKYSGNLSFRPKHINLDNCTELLSYSKLSAVEEFSKVSHALLERSKTKSITDHAWYGIGLNATGTLNEGSIVETLKKWTDALSDFNDFLTTNKYFEFKERSFTEWENTISAISTLPDISRNPLLTQLPSFLQCDLTQAKSEVERLKIIYEAFSRLREAFPESEVNEEQVAALNTALQNLGRNFSSPKFVVRKVIATIETISELRQTLPKLQQDIEHLLTNLSLSQFAEEADTKTLLPFLRCLIEQSDDVVNFIKYCDIKNVCRSLSKLEFEKFKQMLALLKEKQAELQDLFDLSADISPAQLENYYSILNNQSLLSFFNSNWWKAKAEIKKIIRPSKTLTAATKKIPDLVSFKSKSEALALNELYSSVFGDLFKGLDTDIRPIQTIINWAQTISDYLRNSNASLDHRRIIFECFSDENRIETLVEYKQFGFHDQLETLLDQYDYISSKLNKRFQRTLSKNIFLLIESTDQLISDFKNCEKFLRQHEENTFFELPEQVSQLQNYSSEYKNWRNCSLCLKLSKDFLSLDIEDDKDRFDSNLEKINEILDVSIALNKDAFVDFRCFVLKDHNNYLELARFSKDCQERVLKLRELGQLFFEAGQVSRNIWEQDRLVSQLITHNQTALKDQESLHDWINFVQVFIDIKELRLTELANFIQTGEIQLDDLENAYKAMAYDFVAEKILNEHPILNNLNSYRHDQLLKDFRSADIALKDLNVRKIKSYLMDISIPSGRSGSKVKDYTDLQLINHELGKKRMLLSNRELLSRAGNAIISLKPCFMMSPLSVAQFLKPGEYLFDVVIMDEASQIKPEDAIGVISRGVQLVIVGDPQQLPPTNFFQNLNNDEDDEEELTVIDDSESILDVAWERFDRCLLNWHYRSRHQSLIEFSNHYFYNDRLTVFPSPFTQTKSFGVHFNYVLGTFKTGTGINETEAQEIALAVASQVKHNKDESFGIVAMNARQSEYIRNAIESLATKDYELRHLLDENSQGELPWFVKNLENVQGDERDVIFISLTYGPLTPGGKVPQRFGPITSDKGERRLNVLFSRARKRMEVFSSMRANDIVADNSRGAKVLHDFLEYCTTKQIPQDTTSVASDARSPDSDFEIAVAEALAERGYKCIPQVGVQGYYIDIGVLDPRNPNKYIVGIECDGATYHSHVSARERDRLRQEVLEGLGWKILRVWSTDWYKNSKTIIKQIDRAIQDILDTEVYDSAIAQDTELEETSSDGQDSKEDKTEPISERANKQEQSPEEDIYSWFVLLDKEIRNDFPDTDEDKRLLRKEMVDYFLSKRPMSPSEFLETCPEKLRTQTSVQEACRYLSRVCQIISEWG